MTSGMAASNWSGTTASQVFALLLVQLLYAKPKEVYFCSFVTKSYQTCIKYSPNVFNSFYQKVTHGKTHTIMYKEILLSMRWSLHFSAFEPIS